MNLNISYSTVTRALLSLSLSLFVLGLVLSHVPAVNAVANSVLPNIPEEAEDVCDDLLTGNPEEWQGILDAYKSTEGVTLDDAFLGCAIKTGKIKFWMIPYFVNYALEFAITIAGVLVVLMIVIGGYYYIYGAVTDDKEKGKTIIMYAIGGYVLVLSAWFIVNAILLAVSV